jgi:glycosyltransferase involved in cell wall biosynthesis
MIDAGYLKKGYGAYMRLIINVSNNLTGGGLQVALSFLEECKKIPTHSYFIFLRDGISNQVNESSFPGCFSFIRIPNLKVWQLASYLKPLEKQIKPDVVFTIFGPSYWKPVAKHIMGFARGYFINPDSEFIKRQSIRFKIIFVMQSLAYAYFFKNHADWLIVETDDAKDRLSKWIGKKEISVVLNTCGSHFFDIQSFPNKLPARKDNEIRLITISAYYQHKNLESIPAVLELLNHDEIDNVYFVLTISNENYNMIIPKKWHRHVYNVGPVSAKECPSLYQECDMLYMPTLLEIFSASYPEAMNIGKPILTSDLSFAHSICGDAALYFDPFNAGNIADVIGKIISNNKIYQECVFRGKERFRQFPTALNRAKAYLKICKDITQ